MIKAEVNDTKVICEVKGNTETIIIDLAMIVSATLSRTICTLEEPNDNSLRLQTLASICDIVNEHIDNEEEYIEKTTITKLPKGADLN